MVTVALAGATTGFGLTMLRIFLRLNNNKHKIVLLSRSEQPALAELGVDVRPVDYTNHEQLVHALRDVHTLLSVIGGTLEASCEAQLSLIAAAKEAGVKRFAPSEYAGVGYDGIDFYQPKFAVWEATKASGMEYTRYSCGIFMSVFATGTPKPVTDVGRQEGAKTGEEEALAGLRPWNFVINMKSGTCDMPGDGSQSVVFTDMRDVAIFVFRSLDLETWPAELGMRGDVASWREVVDIVERVQNRGFLVKENSVADMEKEAEEPSRRFYNHVRIQLVNGWGMVGDDLNKSFPDIKTVKCDEFIHKWWSDVQLGEPSWQQDQSFM